MLALPRGHLWLAAYCFLLMGITESHSIESSQPLNEEARLVTYLRARAEDHGTYIRPILDPTQNITVEFGLRLIQVDIIEDRNVMETSVWIRQRWKDEILTWNASEFGGLDRVTMPMEWIWTPPIELVNTASAESDVRYAHVVLRDNGNVFWVTHRVFESACLVDLADYPLDNQRCDLWFQSLSLTSSNMDLITYLPGFDYETMLGEFLRADEWEIVKNISERVRRPQDYGEKLVFSRRVSMRFTLFLRRRVGFTAIMHCVSCVALSFLTLLVFVLPPERPDRNGLATALLSSFFLLLLILVGSAPPSAASVPRLGIYYAVNIFLVISTLVLSVTVIHLSARAKGSRRFPRNLIPVTNLVASIFLVKSCKRGTCELAVKVESASPKIPNELTEDVPENDMKTGRHELTLVSHPAITLVNQDEPETAHPRHNSCDSEDNPSMDKVYWTILALTLDRLFFTLNLVLIIVFAICLLPLFRINLMEE